MRKWFKYHIRLKNEQAQSSLFLLQDEINGHMSYDVNYNVTKQELLEAGKASPLVKGMVAALEKVIRPGDRIISIGCSNAEHEVIFLNKHQGLKLEWDLTDYDERSLVYLRENFPDLTSFQVDILHKNFEEKYKNLVGTYDVVYVPGILYLFDKERSKELFKNLKRLVKDKDSKIVFCFRSRDHFYVKIIDWFLSPINTLVVYVFRKFIKKENVILVKSLHGFRRSDSDLMDLTLGSGMKIKDSYHDCFDLEFTS